MTRRIENEEVRSQSDGQADEGEAVEPPEEIQARTYRLSLRIVKPVRAMPRDLAGVVLGRQVLRSGTSIGASCEEAKAG